MSDKKHQLSEHFINFVIKGEEMDFNVFKTREEFDLYKKELEEFLKKPDSEIFKDTYKYRKDFKELK